MFKSGPTQGSEAGAAHATLPPPGENCLRPEDEASSGEKPGESGVLVGSAERLHRGWFMSMYGKNLENPSIAEPGGLPSMGSHRVGHNWSDLAAAAAWHKPLQQRKAISPQL